MACSQRFMRLDGPDVLGLKAFRAFYNVELDRLTFLKRTKPLALDG